MYMLAASWPYGRLLPQLKIKTKYIKSKMAIPRARGLSCTMILLKTYNLVIVRKLRHSFGN